MRIEGPRVTEDTARDLKRAKIGTSGVTGSRHLVTLSNLLL